MRVLVTGATGFVGKNLLRHLAQTGQEIAALVRPGREGFVRTWGATPLVVEDLAFVPDYRPLVRGFDALIHLANKAHVTGVQDDAEYAVFNRDCTVRLAEACRDEGMQRFLFLSSVKAIGEHLLLESPLYDEQSPCAPVEAYARYKRETEIALLSLQREHFAVLALRPPLMYGPGAKANMATLVKLISRGIPLPFGNRAIRRSLLNVDNLCAFLAHELSQPSATKGLFHITDGRPLPLRNFCDEIAKQLGKKARYVTIPQEVLAFSARTLAAVGATRKAAALAKLFGSFAMNSTALTKATGWTPPFTMSDGIAAMLQGGLDTGVPEQHDRSGGTR